MTTDDGQSSRAKDVQEALVIRHAEEVASPGKAWRGQGFLRARRRVETATVDELVPANVEELALERVPAEAGDSGKIETLADGSVSIPLFAEELVVVRRTVLRERVIVRKETTVEEHRIEDELRREVVEIDADDGVEVVDHRDSAP